MNNGYAENSLNLNKEKLVFVNFALSIANKLELYTIK